jgi:hypothetical protein
MRVISVISRAILALAICGFLSLGGADAGTCVNRQDGPDTVQSCDNGSFTVTDRHGRRRVYGTPNARFERYPGQWLYLGAADSTLIKRNADGSLPQRGGIKLPGEGASPSYVNGPWAGLQRPRGLLLGRCLKAPH